MLKAGTKRRRTKAEMEEFKLEQIEKEERERELLRRIGVLEQKVIAERQNAIDHQASTNILQQFVNEGQVVEDDKGQWHVCVQQKAQEA